MSDNEEGLEGLSTLITPTILPFFIYLLLLYFSFILLIYSIYYSTFCAPLSSLSLLIQLTSSYLPYLHLYDRLKSSEIDRARGSFRLSALQEKVSLLEAALLEAKKDKERLQKAADKFEASKAALTRKDAVIKVACSTVCVCSLLCPL